MSYQLKNRIGARALESQNAMWILLRILASAMFIGHGFDKLFGENPQPFTAEEQAR